MPRFYLPTWLREQQKNNTPEMLAKLFIESDSNPASDQDLADQGKTLLHYTAAEAFRYDDGYKDKFRLALIKQLFEQKIDANAVDNTGKTALHDFALAQHMQAYYFFDNPFPDIAKLFFQNAARFTIQDNTGKTPLDLALSKDNILLAKTFIGFMLLENPQLTQPSSIDSCKNDNHRIILDYWSIYKNIINALQNQKIPGTELNLHTICAARNLTKLAKQNYLHYEQIQNFDAEEIKNKFHDYSDQLLVNLQSLQQELSKQADTQLAFIDVADYSKLNRDTVEKISTYLTPKEFQVMHVAANPHALFKYKPELSEQTGMQDKMTKYSYCNCCIS